MSECSFSYPMPPGDPKAGLDAARKAIVQQGGFMRGDTTHGDAGVPTPVGDIALSYRVSGAKLLVDVTDKPFFVSCAQIDQQLRAALAQVPKPKPAPKVVTTTVPYVVKATVQAPPAPPKPAPSPAPKPAAPKPAPAPAPKVTVMPTQYIEGDVSKPGMSLKQWGALAIGVVAAAGGTYWFVRRTKR